MRFRTTVELGGRTATGLPVPAEVVDGLGAALEGDDAARRAFAQLPYSHRQRHVLAVEAAKAPETRHRRIEKALEMLREGRR
jgi:uncharacterized protein YdeI (YjbR/CyaY-like superfamily)